MRRISTDLKSQYHVRPNISYQTISRILRQILNTHISYLHISYHTTYNILIHSFPRICLALPHHVYDISYLITCPLSQRLALHHLSYLITYCISPYISYFTTPGISPHLVTRTPCSISYPKFMYLTTSDVY